MASDKTRYDGEFYTYDTPRQIAYCLSYRRTDCVNCLRDLRVNEVPEDRFRPYEGEKDPCLDCYSRTWCRSGACGKKTAWRIRHAEQAV